jgi:formylglycine-generating enzyme required for sulfatase activity
MANFNGHQEYIGGVGNVFNGSGVSLLRTTAVGSYDPNSAGLYDMAGNVLEWCQDWFGNFTTNSVVDPQGPGTGTVRVLRGGAFNSSGSECRSAARAGSNPVLGANTIGFRMVLVGP